MSSPIRRIALTPGEPAGIGPDLVAAIATHPSPVERVVIADQDMLVARATALGHELAAYRFDAGAPARAQAAGEVAVDHIATGAAVEPGRLDPHNARYVLATLTRAVDGCLDGSFAAMVTAPVHKGVINDAGIPFTGHTAR